MDLIDLHRRAVEQAAERIARLSPDQLSRPTPCTEWDVRDLLNHMIGGNWMFARAANGEQVERPAGGMPDLAGTDPAGAYAESAKAVLEAWDDPSVLTRTVHLPFGEVPGQFALGLRFSDTVVHTWDLARATGQDEAIDAELCRAATEVARANVRDDFRGPGRPFAAPIDVPADAPPHHQLAAFLGRQP
jgi:uncharacterized protein (TIGR03086 family)